MIRHIFIGTFKDDISKEIKEKELADMKAMKEKIPTISDLQIGFSKGWAGSDVLHDTLAPKGIFVGSVLVSGVIAEGDEKYDPSLIAKQYWKMYTGRSEYQLQY